MSLQEVISQKFNRNILIVKKQSPHIFFAAGIIGTITSTVLACRATLKLSDTLDEIHKDIHDVNQMKNQLEHAVGHPEVQEYTYNKYKQDVSYVYVKAGLKIAKLYAPSAVVGAASIGLLTGSHVQMTRRNSSLMAAYALVQKAYDDYRDRVREQLGEEHELELYHAVKNEIVKNEDGKNEDVKIADPNKWSPYARIFDEYSPNWEKDPELNRIHVQCQQNYANHLLRSRGHIFLNEVYDMLGLDRTRAGAVVGWVIGKDGDNFVDFGIYEAFNSRFVNGMERSIILDFNVDGVIYDKI